MFTKTTTEKKSPFDFEKGGGPAFPPDHKLLDPQCDPRQFMGMTLRDYFAGQALAELLAVPLGSKTDEAYFANHSYKIADAMLEARTLNQEP